MSTISRASTRLLFFLLIVYLTGAIASDDKQARQVESKIWLLEERYVAGFRDANHAEVIPMWHDRFLGWPAIKSKPLDKDAAIGFLKRHTPFSGTWDFEIEKAGIRIHGDVAVTHLIIHRTTNYNGKIASKRSTRVTHTWAREGSTWKIIGGMSAEFR